MTGTPEPQGLREAVEALMSPASGSRVNAVRDNRWQDAILLSDLRALLDRFPATPSEPAPEATVKWSCDDYQPPLTCYTVPNGPKHLTCGGCREAFPNGPEVQRLYRLPEATVVEEQWRTRCKHGVTSPRTSRPSPCRTDPNAATEHRTRRVSAWTEWEEI